MTDGTCNIRPCPVIHIIIMIERNLAKKNHVLNIDNREKGTVTGVIKVISSNHTQLLLDTSAGGLTILGGELKIQKFNADEGYLSFEGTVNSFKYSAAKVPFFKKIFS